MNTEEALKTLRVECERAIELDAKITPGVGSLLPVLDSISHSRTHSARTSRALLIAEKALGQLQCGEPFTNCVCFVCLTSRNALAAIAAEFSEKELRSSKEEEK